MNDEPDLFTGTAAAPKTQTVPDLRVATLTEPFATLMELRAKRMETRSRSFPRRYRGEVAIQAAKGWPKGMRDLCGTDPFYPVLRARLAQRLGIEEAMISRENVAEFLEPTLGQIIALGEMVDDHWTDDLMYRNRETRAKYAPRFAHARCLPIFIEEQFGDYGPGRLALEFKRVRGLIAPIPVTGMLGLWKPDPETAAAIRFNARDFETEVGRLMRRASGQAECPICRFTYEFHPNDPEHPYLKRACTGEPLKL